MKPFLQYEDIELATILEDIHLVFVLFLGRKKEWYNNILNLRILKDLLDSSAWNEVCKQKHNIPIPELAINETWKLLSDGQIISKTDCLDPIIKSNDLNIICLSILITDHKTRLHVSYK